MLAAERIVFEYSNEGTRTLSLRDVSLHIEAGEIVGLVGRSGAGKSTLARIVSGLLAPQSGQVCCDEERTVQPQAPVAFVVQDYRRAVFPWLTVRQNIELGGHMTSGHRPSPTAVIRVAKELGVEGQLEQHPPALSGGQIQRVQVARALYAGAKYLVLDEPTTSWDLERTQSFHAMLRTITRQRRIGVLLVTHEIDDAVLLSSRLYVLAKNSGGHSMLSECPGYGVAEEDRSTALGSLKFGELYRCVYEAMFGP